MPLGDVASFHLKSRLLKIIISSLGDLDLHCHIRWQAIKKYIENAKKSADIGCGWGIMSFELIKLFDGPVDCVDVDPNLIQFGKTIARKLGIKRIRFIVDSLPRLSKLSENYYDQILLIDVLEHVKEDLESLIRINSLLKIGGVLIISVPTPNFPRHLSRKFSNNIGHVRDGYTIKDLIKLLKITGFKVIEWSYHTNLLSPYICKFYYSYNIPRKLKIMLFPLLRVLIILDPLGKGINSCGIVVKARKITNYLLT